jgi:hypothetical protein
MSSEATREVALAVGNTHGQAKGLWALGGFDDLTGSRTQSWEKACWESGRGGRQTGRWWGVCEQALEPRRVRKGLLLINGVQSRGQNRTREIRPSGIVGGLAET